MQHRTFLDYASTTPVHPEVLETYCELLKTKYYNSDALYDESVEIQQMMEKSRHAIGKLLNVSSEEIIFTSGASESNNLAIKGIAFSNPSKKHLITTQVEHSSVLNAFKELEEIFGYEVTYLPVNQSGVVDVHDLIDALRKDTCLVSIMYVNNEVGSIQPINEIKAYLRKNSAAFLHVDAVQALGKIELDCTDIDCVSLSAHKIEGLKGSGILIKKHHVNLVPLINGGQQEFGLRGGTSNALVNVLFAKTLRLALDNQIKHKQHIEKLRQCLLEGLCEIEGIHINNPEEGVPNILNFSYPLIPSEVMMNFLNKSGFCVSAQSTCASKSHAPSKVLKAMGFDDKIANSCIRVSYSYHTTKEDLKRFVESVKEGCERYGTI